MLHSIVAEFEYAVHLCHVLSRLMLLPPSQSPDRGTMTNMIKTVYVKLKVVLTKASDMSITSIPLLEYIKGKQEKKQQIMSAISIMFM